MVYRANETQAAFREPTADFCEQANSLGATLEPGGTGSLHVGASDLADELVFLPVGCSRTELSHRFAKRPSAFVDKLLALSRDDRVSPALVWLKNGAIVSINRARFRVGMNETLNAWRVEHGCEITVTKEAQSPNGFLSISFGGAD
jgi:hypothetical protein